jgi:ketosteroid isomerase-like protein
LTQLIDANDDQAVSVARHYGRGKGSGVEVETVFANMTTFRDGKAIRWEMFQGLGEALEAAELRD